MLLVWTGLVLVLLKWLEIAPVAGWSWLWVLSPFGLAFIYFEYAEKLIGRDRRIVEHVEAERMQKERARQQFQTTRPGQKRTR